MLIDVKAITGPLTHLQKLLHRYTTLLQTMHEWFRSQSHWLPVFDNADTPDLVHPFMLCTAHDSILVSTHAGAVPAWTLQHIRPAGLEARAGSLFCARLARW